MGKVGSVHLLNQFIHVLWESASHNYSSDYLSAVTFGGRQRCKARCLVACNVSGYLIRKYL